MVRKSLSEEWALKLIMNESQSWLEDEHSSQKGQHMQRPCGRDEQSHFLKIESTIRKKSVRHQVCI